MGDKAISARAKRRHQIDTRFEQWMWNATGKSCCINTLLCIASVLAAERLRVAGSQPAALQTERWTRVLFVGTVISLLAVAIAAWK
jgi:hypothetical protein